jgi:hypothetical protein
MSLFTKIFKLKNEDIKKNIDISVQLFLGLIVIGCILKFMTIFIKDNSENSGMGRATASIWGYSLIILAFLGIIILKMQDIDYGYIKSIEAIPYYQYILIGIILFLIYINSTFSKQINKGYISENYMQWDIWNTIFIFFISLLMIFNYINNSFDLVSKNEGYDTIINKLIYFILFLTFIISIIQYIILQNFTVDT